MQKWLPRIIVLSQLLFLCSAAAFSQDTLFIDTFEYMGEWRTESGDWIVADGELLQRDEGEKIASISRIVRQRGTLVYEFDVRYLGGLDDKYGGFGLHILMDAPTGMRSWGQNRSYLLWLTYDVEAYETEHIYAQVYRSMNPIKMDFLNMDGDELPIPLGILSGRSIRTHMNEQSSLHLKIVIDTATGKGRLYHPIQRQFYYDIDLGASLDPGMYIALRTNSVSLVFDNVTVKKISKPS